MLYDNLKKEFTSLFEHAMSPEQMREFLLSMKLNADTPAEVIAVGASVMRSFATPLPIDEVIREKSMDIVGTGGDKIGSFNISSTTALLVASCGVSVAKHGNRSITSKSGSADMFEALGVRLDLSIEQSARLLKESGFSFMFAQNHHPAMKFIMPIRKSIDEKTIFNILGPLTNPASVRKLMLGVFDKSFVPKMLEALEINGATSAMVVSSKEGMDEIGISDITYASRLQNGIITEFEMDPEMYGIKKAPIKAILGGDAKENAEILRNIFENRATDAQRDIVLLNAGASLTVDGIARDMQDGIAIAREVLERGDAKKKLQQIIEVSNKL